MRLKRGIMYSQNNEEEVIARKFDGLVGTFLDIGAYDGVNLSNTRRLAELGWSGVLVDGSSFSFSRLFDLYRGEKKMTLINAMITGDHEAKDRMRLMWESPHSGVSTMEVENYEKWKNYVKNIPISGTEFSEIYVPVVTMGEVLDLAYSINPIIQFVSIDVEGTSSDLSLQFDPDRFSTSMICVEHDGRKEELVEHFEAMGFKVDLINTENLIVSR
jgi:hypothetical protein